MRAIHFHCQDAKTRSNAKNSKYFFHNVFASLCLSGFLFGVEQPPGLPPGVEIKVEAQPQKATVGDPIRFDFDIVSPEGYQVHFPAPDNPLGDFTILEFYPGPIVHGTEKTAPAGNDKRQHYRARIVAAIYKVGEFEFPSIQVALRGADGKQIAATTSPVKIQIQSILSGQDDNLKDLKKQADIHEPARWLLWLSLALLAVLLTALVWWRRRRERPETLLPSQPKLDPLATAAAELRELLSRGLLEKGLVKQFYVALSDIVKKALEAGYEIHTVEQTTGEIMESLHGASVSIEDFQCVESFLSACDLVKFAKYLPSQRENGETIKIAFQILEVCKKQRRVSEESSPTPVAETL